VAPVPMIVPNHAEGAPGPSLLGTGDTTTICTGTRMMSSTTRTAEHAQMRPHFTGKERDSESGNDYFGARYYSSAMGRFMSPDPSGLLAGGPGLDSETGD